MITHSLPFRSSLPGEEEELLNEIRFFVVTHGSGGLLSHTEFEEGQDDMAFVTSLDNTAITIANDVITLPDDGMLLMTSDPMLSIIFCFLSHELIQSKLNLIVILSQTLTFSNIHSQLLQKLVYLYNLLTPIANTFLPNKPSYRFQLLQKVVYRYLLRSLNPLY